MLTVDNIHKIMFTRVRHPLEMANKINDADHILITLQFSSLSKSNARELTITLGFQSAIERADSPVREIICPWFYYVTILYWFCSCNVTHIYPASIGKLYHVICHSRGHITCMYISFMRLLTLALLTLLFFFFRDKFINFLHRFAFFCFLIWGITFEVTELVLVSPERLALLLWDWGSTVDPAFGCIKVGTDPPPFRPTGGPCGLWTGVPVWLNTRVYPRSCSVHERCSRSLHVAACRGVYRSIGGWATGGMYVYV